MFPAGLETQFFLGGEVTVAERVAPFAYGGIHIHADGEFENLLEVPMGEEFIAMNGNAVFRKAVATLGSIARETLAANNVEKSDLDWLVPHQANLRIIAAAAKKLENRFESMCAGALKGLKTVAPSKRSRALAEVCPTPPGDPKARLVDPKALEGVPPYAAMVALAMAHNAREDDFASLPTHLKALEAMIGAPDYVFELDKTLARGKPVDGIEVPPPGEEIWLHVGRGDAKRTIFWIF